MGIATNLPWRQEPAKVHPDDRDGLRLPAMSGRRGRRPKAAVRRSIEPARPGSCDDYGRVNGLPGQDLNTPFAIKRTPWTYGPDIQSRGYLAEDDDFNALVESIVGAVASATRADVRFGIEPKNGKYGRDDPLLKRLQCRRASWRIRLDSKLLDKFFNGTMGIRAQYYVSPYHGGAMNSRLIGALSTRLLEIAKQHPDVDLQLVTKSIGSRSAKAWISEKNLRGVKIIRASDIALVETELRNDWLDIARLVRDGRAPQGEFQLYSAALNGVRAPIPDQLEIKGGWITDAAGYEYVTPSKHDRDCQVFMFGFT